MALEMLVQAVGITLLAPLLQGFIQWCKARLQNRRGPSPLQPYRNLFKLLAKDMAAGVTVGVLALPLAIAFAIASGCSPTAGIWTAIVAGFIINGFSAITSCFLIVSETISMNTKERKNCYL